MVLISRRKKEKRVLTELPNKAIDKKWPKVSAVMKLLVCIGIFQILLICDTLKTFKLDVDVDVDWISNVVFEAVSLKRRAQKNHENDVLSRAPSRIPGFIFGSSKTYFGYVMRDFAQRVLPKSISRSNVLVVSPDAFSVASTIENTDVKEEEFIASIDYSVAGSFLVRAKNEGHAVHSLNITSNIGTALEADDETTAKPSFKTLDGWWTKNIKSSPNLNWILLAVFDPGVGKEDELICSSTASLFLSEATVTYIILGVHATANSYGGLLAVKTLIDHKYKVQILSMSHHGKLHSQNTADYQWEPNTLITTDNVDRFFHWAMQKVEESSGIFRAYLFATRGLDLAIPSRLEYLNTNIQKKRKLDNIAIEDVSYSKCPDRHSALKVKFVEEETQTRKTNKKSISSFLKVYCNKKDITEDVIRNDKDMFWFNDISPQTSEAACVRARCNDHEHHKKMDDSYAVACTTRIIPQSITPTVSVKEQPKKIKVKLTPKPNLLTILIDPISREQFETYLPKTKEFIELLNFFSFQNYMAVGDNSAPNKAALFTGEPLKSHGSRQGGLGSHRVNEDVKWIWDELKDDGYATFNAEDGCLEGSDMIKSTMPNTTHGYPLHQMLCFDFDRPNCVGGKDAGAYLTDHALQFINEYSAIGKPWAAFMSFTDSHEDTMTLAGRLDKIILEFLGSVYSLPNYVWDNTMVVFVSDHGLHYGSHFQTEEGQRERVQPMLHLKFPTKENRKYSEILQKHSKEYFIHPFDVHATVLQFFLGRSKRNGNPLHFILGKSRLKCNTTIGIPKNYCELVMKMNVVDKSEVLNPPSMLSFFADLPKEQKPLAANSCKEYFTSFPVKKFKNVCQCSTSKKKWHDCTSHPLASNKQDTFAMIDCPGMPLSYETKVQRNEKMLSRVRKKLTGRPPSILFLNIDSVSTAHADRHFPKTRELLRMYIAKRDGENIVCKSGLCSSDFTEFSNVGPNPISNQIAALSGCMVSVKSSACGGQALMPGMICQNPLAREHNMKLFHKGTGQESVWCPQENGDFESSWLIDVVKKLGYITLFAEEFCFHDSSYTAPDYIFPLNADIQIENLYCELTSRRVKQLKAPCIDGLNSQYSGQIALEHIAQMWTAYHDIPKFAFLNAMAAHGNINHWSDVASSPEIYDDYFSRFLQRIFSKNDGNTIIIIHSGHGSQGGDTTVEYSTQVEQLKPWTQIIVPEKLPTLNLEIFEKNQNRHVTGFDLYKTLNELIFFPYAGKRKMNSPQNPTWAINVLSREIDPLRNCNDAKVPKTQCRYEAERANVSPGFGICNEFEPEQHHFCPDEFWIVQKSSKDYAKKFLDEKTAKKNENKYLGFSRVKQPFREALENIWSQIDSIVLSQPNERVSGGIFLYKNQSTLLTSFISKLSLHIQNEGYSTDKRLRVCETGFGAGIDNVDLVSFDTFDRKYQEESIMLLRRRFYKRFSYVKGDSCKTVPKYLSTRNHKCDVLHGSSLCPTDNIDLVYGSPCGVILTSTAMSSLSDPAVYFGSQSQWRRLRDEGCISDIACFTEGTVVLERDFLFAPKGREVSHSFCFAVTTGKCQKYGTRIDETSTCMKFKSILHSIGILPFEKLMPQFSIPVPN